MKKYIHLIFIVAFVIGILVYVYTNLVNPNENIKIWELYGMLEQLRQDVDAKDIQLEKITRELSGLKRQFLNKENTRDNPSKYITEQRAIGNTNNLPLDSEQEPEVQREQMVIKSNEIASKIDAKLKLDNRNEDWAFQSEERIRDVFATYDVEGSQLNQVECSNTICRAEVLHTIPGKIVEFVEKALGNPPIEISAAFIPEPIGGLNSEKTIVYYSRIGADNLFE